MLLKRRYSPDPAYRPWSLSVPLSSKIRPTYSFPLSQLFFYFQFYLILKTEIFFLTFLLLPPTPLESTVQRGGTEHDGRSVFGILGVAGVCLI